MKIWYPYTQHAVEEEPLHIESAEGAFLYDQNGNKYLDLISSWWVNIHGHSHPIISKKIFEQAIKCEHLIFSGFTHSPALQLTEKLGKILPKAYEYNFFSDNGSTSVEVAIKMVLGSTPKNKRRFIALEGAYHGDTFGAMSVSARSGFTKKFESELFQVDFIPFPEKGNEMNTLRALKKLLNQKDHPYIGFICEPLVQGASGMRMYSPEILEQLVDLAQAANCTVIFDEVFTGFGRTGKMFAFEHLNSKYQPDIVCLSKGITGGFLPLGVTVCKKKYFDAYYSQKREDAFFHGHSYTGNPLSCAAACASLDLFSTEKTMDKIQEISDIFHCFIIKSPLKDKGFEIRSQGAILAIQPQGIKSQNYFSKNTLELKKEFLSRGLLLRPLGDIVYLVPPYCISPMDLKESLVLIEQTLLSRLSENI